MSFPLPSPNLILRSFRIFNTARPPNTKSLTCRLQCWLYSVFSTCSIRVQLVEGLVARPRDSRLCPATSAPASSEGQTPRLQVSPEGSITWLLSFLFTPFPAQKQPEKDEYVTQTNHPECLPSSYPPSNPSVPKAPKHSKPSVPSPTKLSHVSMVS